MEMDINTFGIAFDTEEMAPLVKAVTITFGVSALRSGDVARLDLISHKNYGLLFEYCMNNPPPGYRIRRRAIKGQSPPD
jgi:hypothetical protein